MRTSPKFVSVALAVAVVVVLGSCSRTFGAKEDAASDNPTSDAVTVDGDESASDTTTTMPDPDSIPTVPMNGPIQTLPKGDPKPVPSKPPQTVPPSDGFDGDPPSFPDFTFTASRASATTVNVTGSGCAGGKVNLYVESDGSEEGGDPMFANPDSSGAWSATAQMASGKIKGTCVAIGSNGASHVGGSHTVTVS